MLSRRTLLGGMGAIGAMTAGCLGGEREVLSRYGYMADIDPAAPLTDVTLYVPIPVLDGEPFLEDAIIGGGIRPEEWSYSITDTEHGPMLAIDTAELQPGNRTYNIEFDSQADSEIDTREALDTEPTLHPKESVQSTECTFPHPEEWDDRLRCYTFQSHLYGEYEPTGTEVAMGISFTGENSWHNGGWTGNEYTEDTHGFVDGTGWVTSTGSFKEGVGRY